MEQKKDKKGSHGFRRSEMKELQEKQANGDAVKMVKANGKNAPEGYKIPKHEAGFVHFTLEDKLFNQQTGDKLSKPFTQKMTVKEFVEAEKHNAFTGKALEIYHYPKEEGAELGSAVEGSRNVDSNFAAMQQKFEALTKTLPPADWTPAKLDAALKYLDQFPEAASQYQPAPPVDLSDNKTNVPPVIPSAAPANATGTGEAPADLAAAAAKVADNTPPTLDGRTSVGTATEAVNNTNGNSAGGTSNADNNGNSEPEKGTSDANATNKPDAAKKDEQPAPPAGAGKRPGTLPTDKAGK